MPTIADATAAMNVLKTRLQTRLNADYATVFAPYLGVDVILEDDEPAEAEQVGKPYILLGVQSEEDEPVWGRIARKFSINAEIVATEFSGAQTGVSNPIGADTLLANAFVRIVREDYAFLRDAGLFAVTCRKRKEQYQDITHRNPHEINGVIFPE